MRASQGLIQFSTFVLLFWAFIIYLCKSSHVDDAFFRNCNVVVGSCYVKDCALILRPLRIFILAHKYLCFRGSGASRAFDFQ